MGISFQRLGMSELLPRYVFAERLFTRRRVLEVDAVASTKGASADFLCERGARYVMAADKDLDAIAAARAKYERPSLRFRASAFDDLEAESFDLVAVADFAPYVRAPELLKELMRLVHPQGYLFGGLRSPAGLSLASAFDAEPEESFVTYGQLLDALGASYPSIQAAAQAPVLGYQLAFESTDGLQVDGTLASASEAAYFVIFAGAAPIPPLDPTWVQLPPEPIAFAKDRLDTVHRQAASWRERYDVNKRAFLEAQREVETLTRELAIARKELEDAQSSTRSLQAQLDAISNRGDTMRDREDLARRVVRAELDAKALRVKLLEAEALAQTQAMKLQSLELATRRREPPRSE